MCGPCGCSGRLWGLLAEGEREEVRWEKKKLTTNHGVFPDSVSKLGWEGEQAAGVGGGGVGGVGRHD